MIKQPKISIITVTFNSQKTIQRTIDSIIAQEYTHIECIFIDGLSSDKTLEIINNSKILFERKNITIHILSEKDKGIYDAMNKGILMASGDIIGFLNSDDFFTTPKSLSEIATVFNSKQVDCVFGDVIFINSDNTIVRYEKSSPYAKEKFKKGWHPMHPTFYVKHSIYKKYGFFDLRYKIASDYEIMLRFLEKNGIKSVYIPKTLVTMQSGGVSNASIINILLANIECFQAWKNNKLSIFPIFILLKPLRKFLGILKLYLKNIKKHT